MNTTASFSQQDISTAITSTVASLISAIGVLIIAYLQKITHQEVRTHGSDTQNRLESV